MSLSLTEEDRIYLQEHLKCNSAFLYYLLSKDILKAGEVDDIKNEVKSNEKNQRCLEILNEKRNCKGKLLRALFLSDQSELADKIDQDPRDIKLVGDIDFYKILECSKFLPVSQNNVEEKSSSHYLMNKNPRGLAIIINIVDFQDESGVLHGFRRNGSDTDSKTLQQVFKELHFKVEVEKWRNIKSQDIYSQIKRFESNGDREMELKNHDAFILVIMSHGSLGHFYASDNVMININELVERIGSNSTDKQRGILHLKDKPKLFFIQACQSIVTAKKDKDHVKTTGKSSNIKSDGKTDDVATISDAYGSSDNKDTVDASESGVNNVSLDATGDGDGGDGMSGHRSSNNNSAQDNYVGRSKDTVVAYATLPGEEAMRDVDNGSWFIQTLTQVLYEQVHCKHILDILTEVNNRVYEKQKRQVCRVESTLQKKFEFFHGYKK